MYSPGLNENVIEQATLVPFAYDYIAADYSGATFDIYTYYQGGSSGMVVATVTVTWTDSTKGVLVSVART